VPDTERERSADAVRESVPMVFVPDWSAVRVPEMMSVSVGGSVCVKERERSMVLLGDDVRAAVGE
jgi:hypothetical protein